MIFTRPSEIDGGTKSRKPPGCNKWLSKHAFSTILKTIKKTIKGMKNVSTAPVLSADCHSIFQRKRDLMKLLMRISTINIFLLALGAACMANTLTNGQGIESTEVTLEVTKKPLTSVFKDIEAQTDFMFWISPGIDVKHKVSLAAGSYTVKDALEIVLEGTEVRYEQKGNYVLVFAGEAEEEKGVREKSTDEVPSDKESYIQQNIVSGEVKDAASQELLAGVNIIVKGTTKGTTTDVEGRFAIDAENDDVLVFTYIGFKSFETQVSGRRVIDVAMEQDIEALKEVVVNAGYWQVKDKEKTGNIARVTSEEIEDQPVSNPMQAIQGRLTGVNIQQNTGLPGSGFTIQIRGQNSLRNALNNNGNLPFYVIDGVPYPAEPLTTLLFSSPIHRGSPLNSINPADIESIEVLKDADATAIYGSQGANGVVLITTKRGKTGKTTFDINVYQGKGEIAHRMDLLNTRQYLEMRNEAFANDKVTPDPTNSEHWDVTKWGDRHIDWQNELIGGAADFTNAQASISGGANGTRFFIGGGYYRETTVIPGDFGYYKASARFNINHTALNGKFNVELSTFYVVDNNRLPAVDPTRDALTLAPNHPELLDEDGNFFWGDEVNYNARNPLAELTQKYDVKTNNLNSNILLKFQVHEDLRLLTSLGYNRVQSDETRTTPFSSLNSAFGLGLGGDAIFSASNFSSWIIEPQVEYNKNIGAGKLSILIGATFRETISEKESFRANGIKDESSLENIAAASSIINSEYIYSQYRYNAFFGRANYNYKGRYIINLTGRRDGSSRFGPDKQFGNFGAVGVAWLFSEENFFKNVPVISFGKLRSSIGIAGSDQIGDYEFLDSYDYTGLSYMGIPGIKPTRIANPLFSWESTKKVELAMELGLLKDKIFLSASHYRNRSSSQLVGFDLAATTGFSSFQKNFPATVENTGWEFELTSANITNENLSWKTSCNLTVPGNRLIEYPEIEDSPFVNRYIIGSSLFVVPLYQNARVDPQTGIYTFDDLNGDGLIRSTDDRLLSDEISQDFFGGMRNTIRYKGIEFDFLFQFVKQTNRHFFTLFETPGFSNNNQPIQVMDRWKKPGDVTDIQMFTQNYSPGGQSFSNSRVGDKSVVDASYIRFKNVVLSYHLPSAFASKINAENLRVYVQGQNLFTVTDFVAPDPENRSLSLPPLRVLTAGIQITF